MQTRTPYKVEPEILATHSQRVVNAIFDYIIYLLIVFGIYIISAAVAMTNGYSEKEIIDYSSNLSRLTTYTASMIVTLVYYNFFELICAQTIGKFISKTIVVDEFGNKPTTNAILMRSICRLIPFEFLTFLGMPSYGWHDRFSETFVVQKVLLASRKKEFYAPKNNETSI